jgi:hypothetical protein
MGFSSEKNCETQCSNPPIRTLERKTLFYPGFYKNDAGSLVPLHELRNSMTALSQGFLLLYNKKHRLPTIQNEVIEV